MDVLVAVSAAVDQVTHGPWEDESVHLPVAYVRRLRQAGADAVIFPPGGVDSSRLRGFGGLVLSGGADVGADNERDEAELSLLREAVELGMPVLGICRGMQLMAVAYGGRLHQHLPDVPAYADHGAWGGGWSEHRVDLVPGSCVAALLGESATVSSGHHQGVADAGTLTVTGRSADGLPEALEDPARRFFLGVQWHPERTGNQALFDEFVRAAAVNPRGERRAAR